MSKPEAASFPNPFGFLMPGMDAMRQWAGMASTPATPPGWVAPTMSVEDLDKRIQELKTVQYWLEQNARMIGATVQALEVQKMTLSTLKSMNVQADELAKALQVKPQDLMAAWTRAQPQAPAAAASGATMFAASSPSPAPAPEPSPLATEEPLDEPPGADDMPPQAGADPVQWWGALNQQFQEIANSAARDWQHHAQRAQAQMTAAQQQAAEQVAKAAQHAKPAAPKAAPKRTAAGQREAASAASTATAKRAPARKASAAPKRSPQRGNR